MGPREPRSRKRRGIGGHRVGSLNRFARNLSDGLTGKNASVRAWVFVGGTLALLVLLLLSIWNEAWNSWLGANAVASTLLITVLLLAVGGAAFFIEDAAHKRVLEDSASSAGFAAVVDQLIDLDLALTLWDRCPGCLAAAREHGRSHTGPSRPFKWAQLLRKPPHNPYMLPGGAHAPGCAGSTSPDPLASMCDEALRRLMAALRSWVDLLTRTDAGLEAVGAINRQRLALATLTRNPDKALVRQTRDRARFLAVVFEAAGGVEVPRIDLPITTASIFGLELQADGRIGVQKAKDLLRELAEADHAWPEARPESTPSSSRGLRQYSSRVGAALAWAADLHSSQPRKGKAEPYLSHILMVVSLVAHYGGTEDQMIAAALHDAAEDQGGEATAIEIGRRFGAPVEEIVRLCSDSLQPTDAPKPPWRERKEAYLAGLSARGRTSATLVEACDKLANLTDIVEDVEKQGVSTLDRFSGGRDGTLWYYEELQTVLLPLTEVACLRSRYSDLLIRLHELVIKPPADPEGRFEQQHDRGHR